MFGFLNGSSTEGVCGANLTWTLSSSGTLIIKGIGEMDDYDHKEAPWFIAEDRNSPCCGATFQYIREIVIENGVTSIGKEAFKRHFETSCFRAIPGCCRSCLKSVTCSDFPWYRRLNSARIPGCCRSLKSVTIPESVTKIGDRAFSDCTSLEEIDIPNSVIEIGDNIFSGCESLRMI